MSTEIMEPRKNKRNNAAWRNGFHLGYESNDHVPKATSNQRNGYISKTVKSTYVDIPVEVSRDKDASFEPQEIPKHTRDVRFLLNH